MRVLQTIHLSDFQKKVLVIVKSSPTPQVAFEELQEQPPEERNNIIGARDVLRKLGMLDVGSDSLEVTPSGEKVMADEYLIDEMGELTEEGQKYLETPSGNEDAMAQQEDPSMMGMGDEQPPQEEPNPFESLELFKMIHDQSKFIVD